MEKLSTKELKGNLFIQEKQQRIEELKMLIQDTEEQLNLQIELNKISPCFVKTIRLSSDLEKYHYELAYLTGEDEDY